jgi:hypothetical protein
MFRHSGRSSDWLAKRAAGAVDNKVESMLLMAFELWQTRGFARVSDEEICCTAPLFGCCEEVLGNQPDTFGIMRVVYDGAQLSRDMVAGVAHPKTAPRPDVSVIFGRAITIRIEAKRLALRESLPSKYVRKGMRRFLDGRYSSSSGRPGIMLGYVVADAVPDIVVAINRAIVNEPDLNEADELKSPSYLTPHLCRYESNHADGLRLVHCELDLTG